MNRHRLTHTKDGFWGLYSFWGAFAALVCVFFIFSAQLLFAATDYNQAYITGTNLGLIITTTASKVDSSSLAPSDTVASSMRLANAGAAHFDVHFKTHLVEGSEKSPNGGHLADVLLLTISENGRLIVDRLPMREAAKLPQSFLFRLSPDSAKQLDFELHFPESADNAYQGASFKAYWTFVTIGATEPTTQPETQPETQPGTAQTTEGDFVPTQAVTDVVGDEDVPLGPALTPEIIEEVVDEEVPLDLVIPKTGQVALVVFWVIGGVFVGIGVWLRKLM